MLASKWSWDGFRSFKTQRWHTTLSEICASLYQWTPCFFHGVMTALQQATFSLFFLLQKQDWLVHFKSVCSFLLINEHWRSSRGLLRLIFILHYSPVWSDSEVIWKQDNCRPLRLVRYRIAVAENKYSFELCVWCFYPSSAVYTSTVFAGVWL